MSPTIAIGLGLGMLGALMMNIGKGVQKQYVQVWRAGRAVLAPEHRHDFGWWWIGMGITAGAVVPFGLGIRLSGSPSTISAMTGIGLIGLTIYALKVIGESISRREIAGIALVVLGTSALPLLTGEAPGARFAFTDAQLLRALAAIYGLGALGCLAARKWIGLHGIAWGIVSGASIGSAMFMFDVANIRAAASGENVLLTALPYVALAMAIGGTITTQVGFMRARALTVVPSVNSAIILTPLLLEFIVYRQVPPAIRMLFIAFIVAGVYLLSTGAAAKVES